MDGQKAIRKYLRNYAETAVRIDPANRSSWIPLTNNRTYHQAVVIPAFDESENFIARLQQLTCSYRTLFIIVLNGPADMSQGQAYRTLQPLRFLHAATNPAPTNDRPENCSHSLFHFFELPQHDFLIIDLVNTAQPHPSRQGVGYARKFGMDCCLRLYQEKQLVSPLVRNTDADVHWPVDYLNPLPQDDTISALMFPFCHTAVEPDDMRQCEAAALYDSWLRYYVAGLRWARSPWAFHTVGSTLVIHLHHYAIQRGFPKRQAGEDFYLLNKLAKSGRVVQLPEPQLNLSNRSSTRTPFGTGKSINSIKLSSMESWKFYHPGIFAQLKFWYEQLPSLYSKLQTLPPEELTLPEFPQAYAPLHSALMAVQIDSLLQHSIRQSHDQAGFQRHLGQGIDASVTRRLVHWLRDHFYPAIGFQALCAKINNGEIPFIPPAPEPISTASQLALYLQGKESYQAL